MIELWIEGVGIYAPGLVGWEQASAVLAGRQPYYSETPPKLAPALLPADVRRRTTEHIRLAVEVAGEAVRNARADGAALWSVFATSESDGVITQNICEEVAKESPEVSPTRFHNSVTNAPAGYWCMAVQAHTPSTSLAAFDGSFAAGLIEAGVQVASEKCGVLLVTHDTPFPEPLHSARPIGAIFGAALVLAPARTSQSLARLVVHIEPQLCAPTRMQSAELDGLRTCNAAARSLPLLAALARGQESEVIIPYVHSQSLRLRVTSA